jgi:hypothetical protein
MLCRHCTSLAGAGDGPPMRAGSETAENARTVSIDYRFEAASVTWLRFAA